MNTDKTPQRRKGAEEHLPFPLSPFLLFRVHLRRSAVNFHPVFSLK